MDSKKGICRDSKDRGDEERRRGGIQCIVDA